MTALRRRLQRLERSRPEADPWAGIDRVLADLTDAELHALIDAADRLGHGRPTTAEQDAARATVEGRLRAAGIGRA